jgi:HPt (histidine-containing phosphotransfer) domain-containing protein
MKADILNWTETLILCNNNKDLALELIEMLKADLPMQKQIILDAYDRKDTRMLRDIVHQILGSCSYISLPQLKQAATAMHDAIHQQQKDLSKERIQLIEAIDNAILFKL